MHWHRELAKLGALFRRRKPVDDLAEEIRSHLAMEEQENLDSGMPPDEAHYVALRRFGNVVLAQERSREMWGWSWAETLWQDIRFGARMLAKNPGFTAVAVVTLALGIGMNTAIFSLVDQLLLWTVPAREPNQLVKIEGFYSRSYPFFCAYRDLNQMFSGVLASSDNYSVGIRPAGAPGVEVGHVEYVSGGYFQVLGIGSATGRVINPSDDGTPGGSPVALLSYRYWQRRFAGDLRVIGQKLAVNSYPLVIVGVAEKGFGGLFNGDEPDAFVPLTMYPVTTPSAATTWNKVLDPWLTTVARLKPGISFEQARAGMPVLWSQAMVRLNDRVVNAVSKAHQLPKDEARLTAAARAPRFIRNQRFLDPIKVLAVATVLVLLIACANVANLLLARASQRWKDTAVRLAIGATRGRLIRQFLTESVLLAAGGSVVGLGFAFLGVWALARAAILDPDVRFRLSLFVLVSCAGLTLLTIILFGLVPAFRATRMTLAESMKEGGLATQTISRSRLSKLLVANQIALSLTLLVLASLFGRTLRNLQHVDLGFQRENIAIFDIDPASLGYQGQRLRTFYEQLLERARAAPGVRSAALSGMAPMSGYIHSVTSSPSPGESGPTFRALYDTVSPGYFTTLGIPLLAGRDFRPEDDPAVTTSDGAFLSRTGGGGKWVQDTRVCIMDETLARKQFGTANAVGRHFCLSGEDCTGTHGMEVVGVVKDAHYGTINHPDEIGMLYEPTWSSGAEFRLLEVRYAGDAASVIAEIRRALQGLDPNVPLPRVRMMEEYVNSQLAHERLVAYLSSFFGIIALALTSVGLYGVIAYAVTQRTREIGIRMAMGAQRKEVIGMVLRESTLPVIAGVVIGLVVAFSGSVLIGSMLYGVDSFDLESVLLSVAVLLAAALLAATIPARRATKVDPMVALRHE